MLKKTDLAVVVCFSLHSCSPIAYTSIQQISPFWRGLLVSGVGKAI